MIASPGKLYDARAFRYLLAAKRILDSTNSVANLSRRLVRFALTLQFGIATDLSRNFFDFAFGLLRRALNPILVHACLPCLVLLD